MTTSVWLPVCQALILAMGVTGAAHGQPDQSQPGMVEKSIQVGGVERWFRVFEGEMPRRPAPVVILMHGGGQGMRPVLSRSAGGTRAWLDLAKKGDFLLVVPNGTDSTTLDTKGDHQRWNDVRPGVTSANDVGFMTQLIDWLARNEGIDRKRVFLTGAADGGLMVYRLLMEASDRFAAAAVFSGKLPERSPNLKEPTRPVPLLIASGTEDKLMPWAGGRVPNQPDVMRSAADTVAWWVKANRARPEPGPRQTLPDADPGDGCAIHLEEYALGKPPSAPVMFYTVEGGGHGMPSRDYVIALKPAFRKWLGRVCRDAEGAELALQFFRRFGL
ncbi:MAG: hypothetical protein JNL98_08495 [Bryobacterales bacterium]|nr:hypothetical protein [Bryobacterales bacterium]